MRISKTQSDREKVSFEVAESGEMESANHELKLYLLLFSENCVSNEHK